MKRKRKIKSVDLIGRDSTYGRVAFQTGAIKNMKDKLRNRNSKVARKERKERRDETS